MAILMSKLSRSSGAQLLDETDFTYANDTANLGRLVTRVRTHHDGASYASTEAFTYVSDPELAGALLCTRTLTTHDGLTVATSRSCSVLTGRLWRQTDARGATSAYTYDALGRMRSRTLDPRGDYANTMSFDHAITGGAAEAFQVIGTDCNGNKRCHGLDGAGRAVYTAPNSMDDGLAEPDPQKYQTGSCTYDDLGRLATSTQADWALDTKEKYARTGTLGYDDWGRAERMDYDDGTWTRRARDPIGLTVVSAMGGTNKQPIVTSGQVVRTYDVSGKLLTVSRYAAGADPSTATPYSTRTMVYDGLHRLRSQTDALGVATTYDYDNWNRLVQTTLADGTVLTRRYRTDSAATDVVEITLSNTTARMAKTSAGTRVFDGLGRVTSASIGGRTWQYQYDSPKAGSPLMDARPTQATAPDGTVRKYTYIAALGGKVKQVDVYKDATLAKLLVTQSFEYDSAAGALTSAVEGTTTKQYTSSTSGRLKAKAVSVGGNSRTMTYDKYTLRGKLRQYTHVDAAVRVTGRNPNGTISAVSDGAMQVTLGYDAAGRLTSWTASDRSQATPSLTTTLTLDDYGRETARSIATPGQTRPSWQISQSWNVADQLLSRITKRAGATYRVEQYKYDSRHRLQYWEGSGAAVNDRYGNVLRTQTFTADPFNNLTQVVSTFLQGSNTATFTYTDATDPCRLVSFTNSHASYPSAGTLTYDLAGRITADGMGQTLGYDSLGRLTQATSTLTGHTGSYVYDAHNCLSSQTVDGQVSYFYYKANALVNLVQGGDSRRLLRSPAGCTSQYGPGGVWLSATDAAGSVLAANQGSTTEMYSYSAYGEDKAQPRSSTLGYTGQYHDPLTPGYQLGNGYRAYLPALMRFTAPDGSSPFGRGGINSYAYCSGDPIGRSDPSGHFDIETFTEDWQSAWRQIGQDLKNMDPLHWFNKLFSEKVATPATRWYTGQKWARYTPLYWTLYGVGKVAHAAQPVADQLSWMADLAIVVPGMDEADEADELFQEIGDAAYDTSIDASYSSDRVTTSGRFEGGPESLPNYREAPPQEPQGPFDYAQDPGAAGAIGVLVAADAAAAAQLALMEAEDAAMEEMEEGLEDVYTRLGRDVGRHAQRGLDEFVERTRERAADLAGAARLAIWQHARQQIRLFLAGFN
jgi:RHS repeat-associated protein